MSASKKRLHLSQYNLMCERCFLACLLVLSLLFGGCNREILKVHSDYLSCETLASYHVGTPDPQLRHPPTGQRLIISWFLPAEYPLFEDLHLHLRVRYYTMEEKEFIIPLHERKGDYLFCLIDQGYSETGGIASYHIALEGDGLCLEEWKHSLWAEWIALDGKQQHSALLEEEEIPSLPYSIDELNSDF